ncbi:lysine--tRNA ligase [Candidatus Poriferisodalis sp.]|uniref:lysine--tRNA ligase n=1 Tax=Candidatus Poriferisodalis sp. TaxID=3101277 RepID=UPI003B0160B0
MTWIDKALDGCPGQVVVNDSKTPSGRAHVGSLRGVLIHDALARAARERGLDATFMYGCDDMDAVDEIPFGTGEHFVEHLGKPLWAAPAPEGFRGDSMAEAYFGEFTGKWFDSADSPADDTPGPFDKLGVNAEFYRISDIYRSGRLDGIIDAFLRAAADVRQIYLRLSGAERADDWLPFQPICEQCGRIGTTYATDYDGETVAYECRADLVAWATGCGHRGRISPFGGNGKLPWKLEWAAKWKLFGVSIEGAGKDHMAASGSHEVSSALARQVLQCPVPVPVPYEFFTLGGAKMSSSRGIGMTSSDLVELLPPELLRYVVLRTQPRRAIDFALDVPGLTKAFVEYERLWRSAASAEPRPNDAQLYSISRSTARADVPPAPEFSPPFDSVLSLSQQPHMQLDDHIASLGVQLTEAESAWLDDKAEAAKQLMDTRPDLAGTFAMLDATEAIRQRDELSDRQIAFLDELARRLEALEPWSARAIQDEIFESARGVEIDPKDDAALVFEALYKVLFGSETGPRAGSYLEFLGRHETLQRLG